MDVSSPTLYYLRHFHQASIWLAQQRQDILSPADLTFIQEFHDLDLNAQALWVRLTLRSTAHFRRSKLNYPEIEDLDGALHSLIALRWLSDEWPLTPIELFHLARKSELDQAFGRQPHKIDHLPPLQLRPDQRFEHWLDIDDPVISHTSRSQGDRLRLAFFGNLYQDWSEFVLQEIGIRNYPPYSIGQTSGFMDSKEYEACWSLAQHPLQATEPTEVMDIVGVGPTFQRRKAKILFEWARQLERDGHPDEALRVHQTNTHPDSRLRIVRILEERNPSQAWRLAQQISGFPDTEAEQQAIQPALRRLARRLNQPTPIRPRYRPLERNVVLPPGSNRVEIIARDALSQNGSCVLYCENSLFNLLWRLHYWPVLYADIPGAFFNPFQYEPADLYSPEFRARRAHLWPARIDRQEWLDRYERLGLGDMPRTQLQQILDCIPNDHLIAIFERMWQNPKTHRTGFPDLIRLDLAQQQYELIEVKGPGDKLQPHQRLWMAYFDQHNIPCWVCHVSFADAV